VVQKKMYPGVVNSPATELAADITAAQTTIAVLSVAGLLAAEGIATIGSGDNAETITYTSVSGTTLQGCVRGFQGPARAWGVGARVARNFTAYDHDTAQQNIEDLQQQIDEIEIPAATDEVAGIIRTNSATDSDATDEAATPLAVKTVMEAATEAAERADAAFTSASEGKARVSGAITGAKGTVQVADPTIGPTFAELETGIGTILAGSTADANAAAADIRLNKTAYKDGQKLVGTFAGVDTSDATATADDILSGKVSYSKGQRLVGLAEGLPDFIMTPGTDAMYKKNYIYDRGTAYATVLKLQISLSGTLRFTGAVTANSNQYVNVRVYNPRTNYYSPDAGGLTSASNPIAFTQDISVEAGDILHIQMKCSYSGQGIIKDLQIKTVLPNLSYVKEV